MAFNTKISLDNNKVIQPDGCLLTLSGDTTIAANGTLQYAESPAVYSCLTIPDVSFVTGCTQAISTFAGNGLTKDGQTIILGGELTGNTIIDTTSLNTLTLGDFVSSQAILEIDPTACIATLSATDGVDSVDVSVDIDGPDATLRYTSSGCGSWMRATNVGSHIYSTCGGNTSLIYVCPINIYAQGCAMTVCGIGSGFTGVQYVNDYSANYVARSIPDVAYVTGKTSTSGVQTAVNGLTKSGTEVKLGGTLTGSTIITDSRGTPVGIQYGSDYSTAFTARSLVDAGYVTGKTSQAIQTANNGLTKQGQNVKLGGILTGSTCVAIPNDVSLRYFMAGNGTCAIDSGTKLYVGTSCAPSQNSCNMVVAAARSCMGCSGVIVCAQLNNGIHSSFCNCDGLLRTTTLGTNAMIYGADYSACFIARSIPDAAWVTGKTSTSGVQTAVNGLTKSGTEVKLGGALTGNTSVTGAYTMGFNNTNLHLTGSSAVKISSSAVCLVQSPGAGDASDQILVRDTTGVIQQVSFATVTGNTYSKAEINSYTAQTDTRLDTIEADYVTGGTNGLSSADAHRLKLGGTLTENTCVAGSYVFTLNTTTNIITGATTCIGGTVYLKSDPAGTGGLLCRDAVTGQVCETSLASFGGITGATNGLTDCGSQRLGLGGALCANTTVTGAYAMNFCNTNGFLARTCNDIVLDAESNGGAIIMSQSGTTVNTSGTVGVGIIADFDSSNGLTVFNNKANAIGIAYAADYSANYTNRSLVDKYYVDSIATGLQVHDAALVATTAPINLSTIGLGTIDGVTVTTGDRVLVKDQTTGSENGIYSASTGTWGRTSDFDFSPSGEITNGDLIPVTSGSTNNNSIWVLTTPNPITSGDTLTFTKFATIVDVVGGNGIDVVMNGGVHTVSVDLYPTVSALKFCGTQLTLDPLIASSGLTWNASNGTIHTNNSQVAVVGSQIPVKYGTGCALVIDSCDVATCIGAPITTANNGLNKAGTNVRLGGTLTGATNINVASDTCSFTFTDTAATKRGICYGGDYSADFVDRSLVTKYFVNNAITGGTGIAFACNGLTKSGSCVLLGGTLVGNTEINLNTNFLKICNNGANNNYTVIDSSGTCFNYYNNNACFDVCLETLSGCICNAQIYAQPGFMLIETSLPYGYVSSSISLNSDIGCSSIYLASMDSSTPLYHNAIEIGASGITVCGSPSNFSGVTYCDNYSANFTPRSLVDKEYVDNASGGIGGANGLSRNGDNIVLGGTLTGCTLINLDTYNLHVEGSGQIWMSGNSVNLCVGTTNNTYIQMVGGGFGAGIHFKADSSGGSYPVSLEMANSLYGLSYGACYSTGFTSNLSIVDKGYVDKMVTGGTGLSCANNGLTKVGNTVVLGGPLTGNTLINTSTYDLSVHGTGNLSMSGNTAYFGAGLFNMNIISQGYGKGIYFCADNGADPMNMIFSSALNGLMYGACYSTGFTNDQSIVDKGYVDAKVIASATIANNGLTKVGNNIVLGGPLTGDTAIYGAYNMCLGTTASPLVGLCLCASNGISINGGSMVDLNILTLNGNGGMTSIETVGNGGMTSSDTALPSSLAVQEYVTGLTSQGITLANNGLNKAGANVRLGGDMTGETTINLQGFGLCVSETGSNPMLWISESSNYVGMGSVAGTESISIDGGNHTVTIGAGLGEIFLSEAEPVTQICAGSTVILMDSTTDVIGLSTATGAFMDVCGILDVIELKTYLGNLVRIDGGTDIVQLSSNTGPAVTVRGAGAISGVTLTGVAYLETVPSAGSISDSVLVRDGATGEIKTVAGSSLGDKNNIYAMTVVTTDVTLTTGSTYVQLVNNPTSGITVTLPATPINGQVFRIKDAGGNAVNFNITVARNGNLIDGGTNNASINTDSGALELVYNETLTSWFVFSFVN